jgi:hypothetical protein
LRYSPSVRLSEEQTSLKRVPIVLEPKRHAVVDIAFEEDNAVRGKVFGPNGKPMEDVCLYLISNDGGGQAGFDCSDENGKFEITSVPEGEYVLVANPDGKPSSKEPFGVLYYPNVSEKARAAILSIAPGATISGINFIVPKLKETITVQGILSYSDGKPMAEGWVTFKALASDGTEGDANARVDAGGRFSITILKGLKGKLSASRYFSSGDFENCPKFESVIKQSGRDSAEIETNTVELEAEQNIYDVELKFPFPACKKAN